MKIYNTNNICIAETTTVVSPITKLGGLQSIKSDPQYSIVEITEERSTLCYNMRFYRDVVTGEIIYPAISTGIPLGERVILMTYEIRYCLTKEEIECKLITSERLDEIISDINRPNKKKAISY